MTHCMDLSLKFITENAAEMRLESMKFILIYDNC